MKIYQLSNMGKKLLQLGISLAIMVYTFAPAGTRLAHAIAPSNDDFAGATVIASLPFPDSLDTTEATQDVTDPDEFGPCDGHTLNIGNNTVWYQYTPASNTIAYISTVGSDYDTYIGVFTGTEGNLSLADCDDDNNLTFQSELIINLDGGTTYYIVVAEYNGQGGTAGGSGTGGNLVFNMSLTNVSLIPSSFTFQDQLFRTSNNPRTMIVHNIHGGNITLGVLQGSSSVDTTWSSSKDFFIEDDTCSGATIPSGGNCTFKVRFLSWSLGAKSGTITIPSNAPDQPYVLTLKGNAIAGSQLLSNRSYENSSGNGFPSLWSVNPLLKIGQDMVDPSWAFHGTQSFKFVGDGDLKVISQQVNKSGVPGDDFSMFIVTHGNNIPANSERWLMQIMFYNGNTIVENRNVPLMTGSYDFNRKTVMYTATTNYTKIVFRIHFGKSSGAGWVDLASLQWAP